EPLKVPRFQPMQIIHGDLAAIETALAQAAAEASASQPVWLDIEVATQDYLTDLQRRIQAMTEQLPVEVLLLRRERAGLQAVVQREAAETLAELTVDEVFERRLALVPIEQES